MRTRLLPGAMTSVRGLALLLALSLLVVACASGGEGDAAADDPGGSDVADAESDDAAGSDGDTQPVELTDEEIELTFWSWAPGIEDKVALFEEAYPNISVQVVNAGQGNEQYERLRNVLAAGSGGPDVAHFATAVLPEFVVRQALLDLRAYGLGELEGDYPPSSWSLVDFPDGLFGLPWDTGPLAYLYREDIFEEFGLTVPETWDEFAETARLLKEQSPDTYLAQFPGIPADMWVALNWQAGGQMFSVDGETLGFDYLNDGAERLIEFWEPLIEEGLVATDPAFTTEWFSSLASGRYASWVAPSWGPGLLQDAAGDSAGLWRAAPMPQWEPGQAVSSYWGGSTISVMAETAHPAEAAELVRFLLNDVEVARLFTGPPQLLFPTLTAVLEDPDWVDEPFDFYGGQPVNQIFAEMELGVDTSWQWSPVQGFSDTTLNTELARGIDAVDLRSALEGVQQQVEQYARDQGFTVLD